ncbi:PAS domain S-box protein [Alteromonadaceae bacterium M269]|nr:PAS domain S-box protein [Alteromonadaceae bacterium M269]
MWLDKVNVLLVDDHEPNLIALEQVLENPELNIHKASSGQEALEMMLTNEYAIVLLDVNMPEMDGFEVAKLMKARKETRNLPISFVTAINKEKKYAIQGYEIGAVDYLYKPLEPEVVKSKVSVFVELFRLRKQSENRLNVIQSSMDGIAILNEDMRFVSVNDALVNMLGYKEEIDLEGELYELIVDPSKDIELTKEIFKQLGNSGRWKGEIYCKRRDGGAFPVSASLNQSSNGIICIIRDITERKAAEEQMRMLQSVVENANDMVVVTDPMPINAPDGPKIRYVNAAFERVTGYSKEEAIGQTPRMLQGKKTAREQLNKIKQALIEGKEAHVELLNYTKNGYEYYNDLRIVPVKNSRGEVQYFTSIQRDTTSRKTMEQDIKRANKELETFTYITSHDMRSPLVSLKGFCGELEEALDTLQPAIESGLSSLSEQDMAKAQRARDLYIPSALKYIKLGTQKLDSVTGLLLELSRTGRRDLSFEAIDVNQLVRASLDGLGHQIKQSDISVTVDELPDVVADPGAFAQIIGNVLDNAIKYLDPKRPGEIRVQGKVEQAHTIYSVTDNGRGIPKNQMHKVFEVFRRVGDVEHIAGEGMGIAFIKTLLNKHHGRIWCESEVDVGTTFFFSISHHLEQQMSVQ